MWFTLALICAIGTAVLVVIGKRLVKTVDPLVSTFLGYGFSVVFLFGAVVASGTVPQMSLWFFGLALASGLLDALAHTSVLFGLRHTPVSMASPITSFTPVFAAIAAILLLGQHAAPQQWAGILLIAGGAYLLNLRSARQDWLKPIKILATDPGLRLILLASLIWGLTPIIQTQQIRETMPASPLFASLVSFILMVAVLAPLAWRRWPRSGVGVPQWTLAAVFGLVASTVTYAGWTAFTMVNPSFVVAVSKTSIIFGVIFGAMFFDEHGFRERLAGASVMLGGVLLLVL